MKKIKYFHLAIISVIAVIVAVLNPLGLDFNQNILFSAMIFTVALWATSAVHKSIACIFLLITAFVFGKTKLVNVVNFVWSDTNLLIVTTTLLSVGIMKTGLIHKYVEKLLKSSSSSIFKLLLLPYIFGILLIFLIPQAFARVIIIGAIFNGLLIANTESEKKAKQALIFNGFVAVTMTYMFFSNGDIVLNQSAIKFSGDEVGKILTFSNWFKLMSVPTFITCGVTLFLTYLIFRKELQGFNVNMISKSNVNSNEVSKTKQKISVFTMAIIIICWMTETLHHISPWIFAIVGVAVMFLIKVLEIKDLKSINLHFVLFLMTVFSIGKILGQSGITNIIFENLKTMIPNTNSGMYLIIIAIVVMILHNLIGSSVATMSVVLPIFLPLTQSLGYKPEMITLMTYIIVNIHFLLPFNHATVMIGTAKEYYPEKYMLRFGLYMTFITVFILVIYFNWWKLLNIL